MRRNKKGRAFGLRFLTIVMLAVILATGGICGFCSYNIFFRSVGAESSKYDGMSTTQVSLKKEREAMERKEKERQDSGIISYTSAEWENDLDFVIAEKYDAYDILLSIQSDLGIYDAERAYSYSYMRSNDYYDVYTMQQYYNDIEVYGYELKMTADKSGHLLSVGGRRAQLDGFDTSVKLSEDDAYDYAEKYLKSEYQISTDVVSVDGSGKKIFFDENDEPVVGYLFEVGNDMPVMHIAVDANTGKIIFEHELFKNAMIETDLQGQQVMQTLDIYQEYEDKPDIFTFADFDRNIYMFYDWDETYVLEQSRNNMEAAAVDALANIERVYDFYHEYFGRNGNDNEGSDYRIILHDSKWNTTQNAGGGINFMEFPKDDASLAAYLDTMGHEYTHGVIANDGIPIDYLDYSHAAAISEGICDIFGELVEDYCDDKVLNNTCNWKYGADNSCRNIVEPINSTGDLGLEHYIDANIYKTNDEIDGHLGSTIISHSAYLMTQGINGTEALTNAQLANLYYYMLSQMDAYTDFKTFRFLVEQNALNMNQLAYSVGPLKMTGDKSQYLSDKQWESVVDAFDRVGIERSYACSLLTDATLKIYDINNKLYNNYHMTITRANNKTEIVNEDFKNSEYKLPDLEHGIYNVTLYDLENKNLNENFTFIVNDNAEGQKSGEYEKSGKIFTTFGSVKKEVVLALDVSGSMDGEPMDQTKSAALRFISTIYDVNPNIKINIITYSDEAICTVSSSNDETELREAVRSLRSGGSTNMYDALSYAKAIFDDTKTKNKYLIVMSDGFPNEGENYGGNYNTPVIDLAGELKNNDVTICTLGFFHNLDGSELSAGTSLLNTIASPGYSFDAGAVSEIMDVFYDIANQVGGKTSKLIRIACPVDVTVTYNGETLSSAEETLNTRTSFGTISFEGEDNEVKILRLNEDADCEIFINGTGRGKMDYSISFANKNGDYRDKRTFKNVPINRKTLISTNSGQTDSTMLKVDTDGDGKFDLNYIAGKNQRSRDYDKIIRLRILIISAVILFLIIVINVIFIIKSHRAKQFCSSCGKKLEGKTLLCADCGNKTGNGFFSFASNNSFRKQSKAATIAKATVISLCALITAGTVLTYRSAANTVFLQIRNNEFVSAGKLYNKGVKHSWLGKKYLSFVTDIYLDKVDKSYQENKVDKYLASSVYNTVADMDMGKASDRAEEYQNNLDKS